MFGEELAGGARGGHAQIGVDVDLAHAVLDAFDDLFHRHAIGLAHVAAVGVDDFEPLLRYRGRAVHHQVGVGNAGVNFLDAADGQDVAGGRTGELVRTVAGADGNGQGVDLGLFHEVSGLFRVGQQLAVIERAFGADAVFFTGGAGFERAQATEFAFDRHAAGVRHFHHAASDVDVVLVGSRRLAVGAQRAVHHHRAEAQLDGALADAGAGAVILVHDHGNVRPLFNRRLDEVAQKGRASVLARASGGLQDDRRVGLVGGFHDGAHLFEVVDVEGGDAVGMLGRMVEQLTQGNQGHDGLLKR